MSVDLIVKKVEEDAQPTVYDVNPFVRDKNAEGMDFEINVVADVIQNFRKKAVVSNTLPGWGSFQMITDEGKVTNLGDDTAPSPLHYFTVGSAFCLMSHLLVAMKTLKLDIKDMRIEMRIKYHTAFNAFGTKQAHPSEMLGWPTLQETHVIIESDESEEDIANMVKWSCNACIAEAALRNETPVESHAHLNGKQIS
ncbi:MAG: hypothetical protein CMF31_03750 [Kordiimonas sp.]|mgnify:CR=1 FL=1|nr:hypothetical protein [Kordiimonas sp.]